MPQRPMPLLMAFSLIALGGCTARMGALGLPLQAAGAPASALASNGGALVSNNGAGLGANIGPSLIASNAGSLIGQVKGPIPGLLDSGGQLVSNNSASFRVSDLTPLSAPVPHARVAVFDELGNQISEGTVETDANGRYEFSRLKPSGALVFVRATFRDDARPVTLLGAAPAPRATGTQQVAVDLATSLVSKKVAQMITQRAVSADAITPDALRAITDRVASDMGQPIAAAAAVLPKGQAALAFDAYLRQDVSLGRAVTELANSAGAGALVGATPEHPLGPPVPAPTPAPLPAGASGPVVTTLAGSDSAGYADGDGAAARFSGPQGLAVDPAGNVYVADSFNHCIRRVAPNGAVTTLAGSTELDYTDGVGTAARFSEPQSLAVDAQGDVYVADTYNHCIRKIDPAGTVTTLAGAPTPGYRDGSGDSARFNQPSGLAIDRAGNLYVADELNQRIRKIDPDGNVTTLAGTGQPGSVDGDAASASFDGPEGIAVDAAGNVYVSESESDLVRKITPAGVVSTLAGSGPGNGFGDGLGEAADFDDPAALAVDTAGNVYVADTNNNRVRRIDPNGNVTTFAGDGAGGFLDGYAPAAHLDGPAGLAVGPDGSVYVCELQNQRIRKIK